MESSCETKRNETFEAWEARTRAELLELCDPLRRKKVESALPASTAAAATPLVVRGRRPKDSFDGDSGPSATLRVATVSRDDSTPTAPPRLQSPSSPLPRPPSSSSMHHNNTRYNELVRSLSEAPQLSTSDPARPFSDRTRTSRTAAHRAFPAVSSAAIVEVSMPSFDEDLETQGGGGGGGSGGVARKAARKRPLVVRLSAISEHSKRQVLTFVPRAGEGAVTAWIGRDTQRNGLVVHEPGVARVHAKLCVRGDGLATVEDLGASPFGTTVNGSLLQGHSVELRSMDVLTFGDSMRAHTIFLFERGVDNLPAASATSHPAMDEDLCDKLVQGRAQVEGLRLSRENFHGLPPKEASEGSLGAFGRGPSPMRALPPRSQSRVRKVVDRCPPPRNASDYPGDARAVIQRQLTWVPAGQFGESVK
jgi:hypothetical protein